MKTVRFRGTNDALTVGKILCLGRNYAEHAAEMKADIPVEPVVFLKPPSALVEDGGRVFIPPFSRDVHHEVEMVVVIGSGGKSIPPQNALDHVAGYAVGLDMTLRDVQSAAKRQGLPWTVAKGFDTSAPLSLVAPRASVPSPQDLLLTLRVNGAVRQSASTSSMLIPVEAIIAHLSGIFTLEPGDLIFTGTPAGVAAVRPGDRLEASLGSVASLTVTVHG